MNGSKRKPYIDFLKAVGLLGIILAHVKAPQSLMMIRSFDVPLMVLLSAILAKRSLPDTGLGKADICRHIIKRIKRLVIPTWIFLTFFFLLNALLGNVYSAEYYFNSFLLTRYGIGYVWIVLIYLYCAVLAPFLAKAEYGKAVWLTAAVIYVLYELAYYYGLGTESKLIMSTVYFIIPYGILTMIGLHYEKMKKRVKITVCVSAFLIFLILAVYYWVASGSCQQVSIAKYPPRLYYLSYAVAVSFGLLLVCDGRDNKLFRSPAIRFFSSHSFWISLAHPLYLRCGKRG